jgi:2-keto-4-pentenoate hydratase
MPPASAADIAVAAQLLEGARRTCVPIGILTERRPELTERDAYAIQAAGLVLAAEPIAGFKLGYTSAAMRRQMNVDRPNYGRLYASTRLPNAGELDVDRLIHPLIEPEIALLIGADMEVEAVMPAIEIVDTRYTDYAFTAVDNIADNSSAARFVLGSPRSLRAAGDLRDLPVKLYADGVMVAEGFGRDALGDPMRAFAWLINQLARDDVEIPAGTIVLTGGLTHAYSVQHTRQIRATFGGLGDVSLTIPARTAR